MKKLKGILSTAISMLLVLAIVLTPISNVQAAGQNNENQQVLSYAGDGYEVTFQVTSQWDGAFNADVKLKNTSDKTIDNWALQFAMPHEIRNIWNGKISSHDDSSYVIKNVGSNQDVEPGREISFGFCANWENEIQIPTTYQVLSFKEGVPSEKYEVSFLVTSDWGSAFNGEIKIKNNSEEVIEDWQLEFNFDYNIERFWTAEILEHTGNHYHIKNAGYNANIKPNETITLGFSGNPGKVSVNTTDYALSNIVNTTSASISYIDLPDGKIEKDYLYRAIYPNLLLKGVTTETVLLADDYDGDGLTLAQEYEYDTNPFLADTDEDGLDDNAEVTAYNTNPIKWDTDNDEMSDGTEIASGLNPLSSDTDGDGIIDSQEVITQDVRIDSVNTIDISKTLVKPIVEITGKGDYSKKLYVEEIQNDETILGIDCKVGTAFDFVHDEDLVFESSKLTFAISNTILQNNEIEDLAIAYYDDNQNVLQLLDTTRDPINKTLSASVDHFSKYFVVSVPDYFFNIDWENQSSIITSGKADVVFVVDTTGSMGGPIRNVRTNINQFVTELEENKVDIRLGLVEYRDIYEDGVGSTKSYDWYTDVSSFRTKLGSLGVNGGGDTPESAVDAIHCAQNMSFRSGVKKYIILISDANYKDGIAGDSSVTMPDEIEELVSGNIVTSVVTRSSYYSVYSQLVAQTDGVTGNILNNFAIELRPLITKMGEQVNNGCWIRLSNGSIIRLDKDPTLGDENVDTDSDGIPDVIELKDTYQVSVYNPYTRQYMTIDTWTFYSNPIEGDTDGDGIGDVDDLNPCQFDTVVVENTDSIIKFNTGRTWNNITCNTFDYLDNLMQFVDFHVDNPIPVEEFRIINSNIQKNSEQDFSIDELTVIGLINNEGSKIYMNDLSSSTREIVFGKITDRGSKYYKHSGILWWSNWGEVPKGTEGGFFKGKVISEADINFSLEMYYICDVYTVLETVVTVGALVIAVVIIVKVTPVILANIQGLMYFIKTYGIREGMKMYTYLGIQNLPNGVITWLQTDMADGDSSLDDIAAAIQRESVLDKLQRYLLNKEHPVGGSKAVWFEQALGYNKTNMADLAKQIVFNEETAFVTGVTQYGTKFNQIISIIGANGRVIDVTFAWIKNTDGFVKLVTGIPS